MTYYYFDEDKDMQETTCEAIVSAVAEQRAVISYSRGENHTNAVLMVFDDAEQAEKQSEIDTRGACESMRDECWHELATDNAKALRYARG